MTHLIQEELDKIIKQESGVQKPQKQVRIKDEPIIRFSKTQKPPSTPAAKIIINNEIDKSKFLIKNFNDIEKRPHDETPTRKRSKSREEVKSSEVQPHENKKARVEKPVHEISIESIPLPAVTSKAPVVTKPTHIVRKSPPKYTDIEESLIDGNDFNVFKYNEILQHIDNPDIKDKYVEIAKLDSNGWISKGFKIADKNHQLVQKVIITRMELNYKFSIIFNIINKYGNSLEKNDIEFNEKMAKLQKIGEEIRSFIK